MEHSLSYNDVLLKYAQYQEHAKEVMKPTCKVCKVCNGRACAGKFTNSLEMGSKGNNAGFINSYDALAKIRIVMDVIHDDYIPDTSYEVFEKKFDLPVFASPIGTILTDYVIDSPYFNNNDAYGRALVEGTHEAGGMAWLGDNKKPGYFEGQVDPLKDVGGKGVPTIKPWADRDEFWKRVRYSMEVGVMAIATDLDAIGLGYQYSGKVGSKNEGVCSRSLEELKEMISAIEVPVVIKGVMSVKTAVKALEAGAYGILVSNHGGNIVEGSQSPSDVLEDICNAVGDSMRVFADGAVRSGEDVFKLLALGADAVGIGRPYTISVYGGGRDSVSIYTQKIYWELQNIMRLANCRSLKDITRDKIVLEK